MFGPQPVLKALILLVMAQEHHSCLLNRRIRLVGRRNLSSVYRHEGEVGLDCTLQVLVATLGLLEVLDQIDSVEYSS